MELQNRQGARYLHHSLMEVRRWMKIVDAFSVKYGPAKLLLCNRMSYVPALLVIPTFILPS